MAESRWSHAAPLRRVLELLEAREEGWTRIFPTAVLVGLLAGALALGLHAGTHGLQELLAPWLEGPAVLALPALGALAGSWVVVSCSSTLAQARGCACTSVARVRAIC